MSMMARNPHKDSYVTDELLDRRNDYTPDYLDLKMKKYHPVFVYGTLKRGHRLHDYVSGLPYLGEAYSMTPAWKMYDTGHFPVILPIDRLPTKDGVRCIYGEMYVADALAIAELDRVEANGHMYQRVERSFFLRDQESPFKNNALPSIKAFMYEGRPDFWEHQKITPFVRDEEVNGKRMLKWTDIPF